jgi:uncharacterized membrane protein YdbT with pleckstrin-like domain
MSAEHYTPKSSPEKNTRPAEVEESPTHNVERMVTKEAPAEKGETPEDAREAVEKAISNHEKSKHKETEATHAEQDNSTHRVISHQKREQVFNESMRDIRQRMSAPSKTFSKVIHNPVVEDTSEVIGHTIARPTSILSGSFCAFIILLAVYLLAKHNGFALSGFEFIGVFVIGWAVGLLIDFFRHMISGR